ncbi:MAG TPA: hypothetical protein VNO70_09680 [Blastocatellia bacterium]|nr:hypothetical protein [Blastocatellia bacterium]
MRERTTQLLLAAVAILLLAHLARPAFTPSPAQAQQVEKIPEVIRGQAIELVDKKGQVVAQLHVGEDGGGNLRLRSGDGMVRVKLAGTGDGSGLLLFDKEAEPAVWLAANKSGTSVTLAEKGKEKRVIRP